MTSGIPLPDFPVWIKIPGLMIVYPLVGLFSLFDLIFEKRQKRKEEKPVRPLPRQRKRALTLPLPESSLRWHHMGSRRQKTFDQSQSPFFRLPQELRDMIKQLVIVPSDGADLHVAITAYRLYSFPCSESDYSVPGRGHKCWKLTDNASRPKTPRNAPGVSSSRILGILQSCRKMYSESIHLLYRGTSLNVRSTKTIMAMEKVMVPHRLNSISSLKLATEAINFTFYNAYNSSKWPTEVVWYWHGACEVLSKMDGLQDLNIALTKGPHWLLDDPDIDGLARLLRPLMMVQQVSSFNVILYWPRPVDMNELQ